MAGKAKGVCLAGTVEHDGKRYAPGMPVPLPKPEAERLLAKLGVWEGEPVESDPITLPSVRGATGRASSASSGSLPSGAIVVSGDELAALVSDAMEAALPKAVEAVLDAMTSDEGDGSETPDLLSGADDTSSDGSAAGEAAKD
ncbi:MAG: hypothetical protein AAF234_16000 [Pseudomonadota bacterium]